MGGWFFLLLTLVLATAWGVVAIWFSGLAPFMRLMATSFYGLGAFLLPVLLRPRWQGFLASFILFMGVVWWFLSLAPSNSRSWQPDMAVLPWAEIGDEKIVLHNIRNCDYRSETDFTCHYYDRALSLSDLQTIDFFLVYWGSPHIAHTMLSFGFGGGVHVCFSIETRKEIGERYSPLKGFFRQYEMAYVVADERDVVRLRTNYRMEDVYLYRLNVQPEFTRKVFLDYLQAVNRLKDQPEWSMPSSATALPAFDDTPPLTIPTTALTGCFSSMGISTR